MKFRPRTLLAAFLLVAPSSGNGGGLRVPPQQPSTSPVNSRPLDAKRLLAAEDEPHNWLTYGGTYREQRFSSLKKINEHNVKELGLAWYFDLDTRRGQEATPLVIDGVMYFTSAWSKVFALNAATGEKLWSYDPKVPPEWAVNACCDVVNRGVAAWNGKLFVGTLDARLIALDSSTGKPLWQVKTAEAGKRYTITGAPRVVKGKVLIGNGGGEMGVRGYVSAYDAETGNLAWRFYTVPGDPSKPFENAAMEKASKTWTGEWWKNGGGGTVWDGITYDPELDLIYIGVGNGGPWAHKVRSAHGGDNLFTCSIVALRPDTGEYVWHYQENPGDEWDFDSSEQMILAGLKIDGRIRRVLLHAPKNGFFYVLDRETGKLISAKPFTKVSWASAIDLATGRPIENPEARYENSGNPVLVRPGPLGGHSWQPMSFDPQTGFVYLPVQEAAFAFKTETKFQEKKLAGNDAVDFVAAGMPQDPATKTAIIDSIKGQLVAWDPVQQKAAWSVERRGPWNGGTLSTAGNLVFQGTGDGQFEAYRATTGEKLWSAPTESGVIAAPIAFGVKGEEYIEILVGWGGVYPLATGEIALRKSSPQNISRMLVFKLGGIDNLPVPAEIKPAVLRPPKSNDSFEAVQRGERLYQRFCSGCHGDVAVSGGVLPDLRYSSTLASDQWFSVVLGGLLKQYGMVSFAEELSREDAAAVRAYVIFRANQALAANPAKFN
jgi:alcohol dehydrogenase (cytochrome c)/quinohemoprotein ethanol dehydrogenase